MYKLRIMLLCGILISTAGCSAGESEEDQEIVVIDRQEETVEYMTVAVSRADVVKTAKLRCMYNHTDEVEVRVPVRGKMVEQICAEVGDFVKKGDLLLVLTGGDREADIRELEYKIARNRLLLGYTDMDEAYELSYTWWNYIYQSPGGESEDEKREEELESIRQKYRYLREDYQDRIDLDTMQLESWKQEMSESRLYAEIDGKVSYKMLDLREGAKVPTEEALFRIIDTANCLFETNQTEYADCFREGEELVLELDAGSSTASVRIVPYHMENWEEMLSFEVAEDAEIEAGTGGNLNITVEIRENVLSLPRQMIFTAGEKHFVYVQGEEGLPEVRWVEIGLIGDSLAEIVSGLSEGEDVIVR